jgi:hypothetical protein
MSGSSSDSIDEIGRLMSAKSDTTSIEKIMDKFIVKDKNLILKTDIENAKNFTVMALMITELQGKGLKRSAKTLKTFCDRYIETRVSSGRLSWKYVFDAISAIKRENSGSTILSKITGLGDKEK